MTTSTAPAPQLIDTYAISVETGIPPATLRSWLNRGRLTRHGHDADGRALVDRHEVLAIKAA